MLLVCDCSNHRVQRLSLTGEDLGSFGLHKQHKWQSIRSIAAHGDLVAIGASDHCASPVNPAIHVHDLRTGEFIRSFASIFRGGGGASGCIGDYPPGIRFSPDGSLILVTERDSPRLSLFTVEGQFVKHIGIGIPRKYYHNDVCYGSSGEIITTDAGNGRVCVFSADSSNSLVTTWCSPGHFTHLGSPALALAGPYLYLLANGCVKVFGNK